ncbi:hypothetical protein CAI21_21985 [Alkalilimnicola ehrlichii]|uniref:Uncharacterized protein n=2 Tax=Alkalilimnicola ehrlichii TaxID=351052 RepID=A0A3E0WT15_9GAMM|nr:hypothetical protein CAI21_21985 [Alkalilimnicola ehrlichii]RFA35135.1 hypothetical protein CAL65_13595 [Alkalilimnicola ehrlichii]
MHARAKIREAVAERLLLVQRVAGNVYETRLHALEGRELPGLTVATGNERSEQYTDDRDMRRELQVQVAVHVRGAHDFDREADSIAAEVESVLMTEPTLGGRLANFYLSETQPDYSGEGERRVGRLAMTFMATYYTYEDAPESIIPTEHEAD